MRLTDLTPTGVSRSLKPVREDMPVLLSPIHCKNTPGNNWERAGTYSGKSFRNSRSTGFDSTLGAVRYDAEQGGSVGMGMQQIVVAPV